MPFVVPISAPATSSGSSGITVQTKAIANNANTNFAKITLASNTNFAAVFEVGVSGYNGTDVAANVMKFYVVGNNKAGTITITNNGAANQTHAVTGALNDAVATLSITTSNPVTFGYNPGDYGDAFGEGGAFLNMYFWVTILTGQTVTYL
jgi:hypothetical protein